MHRRHLIGGATALAVAAKLPARAETYPARPIRWIIQFAAGGTADIAGRAIGDAVAGDLGQPIVIDPRPGANGTIAGAAVARAAPDGYTWLLATLSHVVAPLLQPTSYHPVDDFVAAARLGGFSSIAVVPASVPARSMAELIELARKRPGALNYFNSGNGSSMHLNTELLKLRAGIDMVAVNYKGLAAGITDLISGRLDFGFSTPPLVLQHIHTGRLRAIGVVGPQRHPELPDVPTFSEQGLSHIQIDSWFVLLAPAQTPSDIVGRMHRAVARALGDPAARQRLAPTSLGLLPTLEPENVQTMLRDDYARFAKLITEANIKAEP